MNAPVLYEYRRILSGELVQFSFDGRVLTLSIDGDEKDHAWRLPRNMTPKARKVEARYFARKWRNNDEAFWESFA